MKKLELKHLDFANNAKVKLSRLPCWYFENINLQDCELSFNGYSKEPYLKYKDVAFVMDQITIYKRPLSQFTQEIEHNGVKFVPNHHKYFKFFIEDDLEYFLNNILQSPYYQIELLLQWHFDIFGLIENNLAIEIK